MQVRADEWRTIPGFSRYEASPQGFVRVKQTGNILKKINKNKRFPKRKASYEYALISDEGVKTPMNTIKPIVLTYFKQPEGKRPIHKNGCLSDDSIWNIQFVTEKRFRQILGERVERHSVIKMYFDGRIEYFSSAKEAGKASYVSRRAVSAHCKGQTKELHYDFTFAYEDDKKSVQKAKKRIEKAKERMKAK